LYNDSQAEAALNALDKVELRLLQNGDVGR